MTDKRSELDEEAFADELRDEFYKLLREPQHTEWLENALNNDPSGYWMEAYDYTYGLYITAYVEEFYDKHLKDKYGDRDDSEIDESDDLALDRSCIISDTIEEVGQFGNVQRQRQRLIGNSLKIEILTSSHLSRLILKEAEIYALKSQGIYSDRNNSRIQKGKDNGSDN